MNRLKELRQEKKLSQKELAKKIGVHYRTLQNWENGESQIKPDKAQALADYFSVHIGYLLGYSLSRENMLVALAPYTVDEDSDDNFDYDVYTALSDVLGVDNLEKIKNTVSVELKNSFGHYFEESELWKIGITDQQLTDMWELHTKKFIEFIDGGDTPNVFKKLIFYFSILPPKERESIINILEGLADLDIDFPH
ncbi:helix-turn-helix transcriptional regulator [Streptococcus suis]|uniref:helix-turn-helix domain-containing protein n=2 Tax=Streptococcus suis TaxID=1307 RepID=UPI00192D80D9|nr:helix-turn-helix transcriptional regulator [Streptococcus suis]MBL6504816.1 helix-turn-helix transcriptional regulator [Streptococcus suis]MBM0242355.1 helix-turn-helix transcriptional regulator [Streptococcus suis]MBM7205120.1 helix-turn-helix transcriptional regulator [Streptococcus suis]MBM7282660.1 helix-turn-helix transcriptional regulator [Streptococcus suis]MBO4116622.1 helix-turn-helix transcriptional regulator [Streptococcus suis]